MAESGATVCRGHGTVVVLLASGRDHAGRQGVIADRVDQNETAGPAVPAVGIEEQGPLRGHRDQPDLIEL